MDFQKLKSFVVTAENLSFSEAAHRLQLSQPAVSYHIKSLEKEFGVKLFDRSGSKLQLTEASQMLLPWARKLVRQSGALQEMMTSLHKATTGQLTIACSTAAGKYILPRIAARFRNRHPGVDIRVSTCVPDEVSARLLESKAQLGVVSREVCDIGLECQEFFEDKIILLVPHGHPWAERSYIAPEELLEVPLIIREATSGTRRVMLEELAQYDIVLDDLNVFLELGNAEAIVEVVAAGWGVSFVPFVSAARALQQGVVCQVQVSGMHLTRPISIVRRELDALHRARDAFWTFVHDPSNKDLLLYAEGKV